MTTLTAREPEAQAHALETLAAEAILGIDTLWGGDVMCPSGTGRFIADSWFSSRPLPRAYQDPSAALLRERGGVGARTVDEQAVRDYVEEIDLAGTLARFAAAARAVPGLRGEWLLGLSHCLDVMWDLALERIGEGEPVAYERCVFASTGQDPAPSDPDPRRRQLADLLGQAGYRVDGTAELRAAAEAWRAERRVAAEEVAPLSAELVQRLDALAERNLLPFVPVELGAVPRANVRFLPIANAWFSGSMNYLGRERDPSGRPLYDATYEINAALQISGPEFEQLVSHEVVPGHVTTFAWLQDLYLRGAVGFEATVLTMNTRAATLFEGIANNAILIAHGVTEVEELPGRDLQIGVLLALLQDEAKNQASWLTWCEERPQAEVAATLRHEYLVSAERADKLAGAWGRHPLLGRMYLPAYRAGTEVVAELRRRHAPERLLPALYGCRGLVDVVTLPKLLAGPRA